MNNELINIPDENIVMEFQINGQNYVVLSNYEELQEDDVVFFAKKDFIENGDCIIRDIESDEEYNEVIKVYEKIINGFEEDEYV